MVIKDLYRMQSGDWEQTIESGSLKQLQFHQASKRKKSANHYSLPRNSTTSRYWIRCNVFRTSTLHQVNLDVDEGFEKQDEQKNSSFFTSYFSTFSASSRLVFDFGSTIRIHQSTVSDSQSHRILWQRAPDTWRSDPDSGDGRRRKHDFGSYEKETIRGAFQESNQGKICIRKTKEEIEENPMLTTATSLQSLPFLLPFLRTLPPLLTLWTMSNSIWLNFYGI